MHATCVRACVRACVCVCVCESRCACEFACKIQVSGVDVIFAYLLTQLAAFLPKTPNNNISKNLTVERIMHIVVHSAHAKVGQSKVG